MRATLRFVRRREVRDIGETTDLRFRLRFPVTDVPEWAARYAYADDTKVEAIGEAAQMRGHYTRDEFLRVAKWKSPRSQRLCAENAAAAVRKATSIALSTADERERIGALTGLRGVGVPTASVLLHLAAREPFPIIDFRALWSLGVDEPPSTYTFAFWWDYVEACRALAFEADVSPRTLDRALWQYSKGNQPKGRSASPGRSSPKAGRSLAAPPALPPDFRLDVYTRLVEAAVSSRTLPYSDLPGGRGHMGAYLERIAAYEAKHRRPPITALVVQKATGRPGPGFAEVAARIGFARLGETEAATWERALRAVFDHWRP